MYKFKFGKKHWGKEPSKYRSCSSYYHEQSPTGQRDLKPQDT